MKKIAIKECSELEDRTPVDALVADVDLVIFRYDDAVMYGRCAHRGALMMTAGLHGRIGEAQLFVY